MVRSAHDTAEGGLAVALTESAIADAARPFGIDVELDDEIATAALLFGEAQGRVVVSCEPAKTDELLATMEQGGVAARRIGRVGAVGGRIRIRTRSGTVDAAAAELAAVFHAAIPRRMEGTPADVETSLESEVQHQ